MLLGQGPVLCLRLHEVCLQLGHTVLKPLAGVGLPCLVLREGLDRVLRHGLLLNHLSEGLVPCVQQQTLIVERAAEAGVRVLGCR